MNRAELKSIWKKEEKTAYIKGWDFSHIHGRYEEENDLPWDYEKIVRQYLTDTAKVLDYDTGGGEFLLLPLGIDFKECNTPSRIPYDNETLDMIINRHGNFDARELYRLLKKGGIFVTQQVGGDNDRDLVEMVLPEVESPFPHLNLEEQRNAFVDAGFHILAAEEAYRPIKFYDIGAFVWFAHIIEWEFPGFSVDKCFEQLLKMQRIIENQGKIEGTIHRYLIAARK